MSVRTEVKRIWELLTRTKNIPVLLAAALVAIIGSAFVTPVFSHYFERGIDITDLWISSVLVTIFSLLLKLLMGYISDRYGRKKIIVGFSFLSAFLTPLYLIFNKTAGLAAVHFSYLVTSQGEEPVLNAVIGDGAPKNGRATLYGVYSFVKKGVPVIMAGVVVFCAGLGLTYPVTGSRLYYFIVIGVGLLILSGVLLLIYLKETVKRGSEFKDDTKPENEYGNELAESDSLSLKNSDVINTAKTTARVTIPGFFLFYFLFEIATEYDLFRFMALAYTRLAIDYTLFSLVLTGFWISFFAVQPFGGWLSDWLKKRKVLIIGGIIVILICNGCMALFPSSGLILFWWLAGIGKGMIIPVILALMVDIVPTKRLGMYFGIFALLGSMGGMLGLSLYGYVVRVYEIEQTFRVTIGFLILSLLVLLIVKERKPL
jgi:MFS family permease